MALSKIKPTESELQILHVLWDRGPSTVREVNEQINRLKESGYTTTLKIMQIMADKRLLIRDTSSRTHIYSAAITQKDTQNSLLSEFLQSAFKGSATNLVMQTLGNHRPSKEELAEIKDLIRKLENQKS